MKTQSESELEISKGVNQVYEGLLGRRTNNIKTSVFGAIVIVMLQNVLTAGETQVAKTARGRILIKDTCTAIVENAESQFIQIVQLATGVDVIDLHHDISIRTGKEIFVFSLDKPAF
jgi:uncharacterized protein YbcI